MGVETFGDCLTHLMKNNPGDHECHPKCLASSIKLEDTGQIRNWMKNRYAPKLDSPYMKRASKHLKLTREQSRGLIAAQARRLALPREPRKRGGKPQGGAHQGGARPPLFVGLLGPTVAEELIAMLEQARQGTGRDEAANTIFLTWRSRDALLMPPKQQARWRAALQAALRNGWQVHYLVQIYQDSARTVSLVQRMLDFMGIGAYVPRQFDTYPDNDDEKHVAASDLLVIPGVAAAVVYSAHTPYAADAGILTRDPDQITALAAHALQLEGATVPLLQTHAAPESPAEAVAAIQEAEDHSGGRVLYKRGLSVFTQPRGWFSESTEPANPDLVMTADEWKRCLLLQRMRIDTFERFVQYHDYYDICPLSALESLTRHRAYPRDDIFVAPHQGRERRLEHLRNAKNVLEHNERYHIGFVSEREADRIWRGPGQHLDTMWQVTGNGHVFLGTWGQGPSEQLTPVNLHISEPTIAQGFRKHFDQMWNKIPPRHRERADVIHLFERAIQTIEQGGAEE